MIALSDMNLLTVIRYVSFVLFGKFYQYHYCVEFDTTRIIHILHFSVLGQPFTPIIKQN
jgi:hypothetical protein